MRLKIHKNLNPGAKPFTAEVDLIAGTPFAAQRCRTTDGEDGWDVLHLPTQAVIGYFGWSDAGPCAASVQLWWDMLDKDVRNVLLTDDAEAIRKLRRVNIEVLDELSDFRWEDA